MAYEAWTVEWDMPVIAFDRFNRFVSYAWGGNWGTPTGGTVDNYNADGEHGTIALPTGDTSSRNILLPDSLGDFDAVATFSVSQLATDANINGQFRFRAVDGSNYYLISCAFDTSGNVDTSIIRVLAGASTTLVSSSNVAGYEAGSDVHVYVQARGSLLRAKIWVGDQGDPPQVWTLETSDANHVTGQVGIRALLSGGNTNVNPVVRVDNLRVWVAQRWVDITPYVDTANGGFTITDGDTPEASADTGGFGLPLLNADQRFTPGNLLSPYSPNITAGRRVRVRETIGDRVFERATCYVQYPEIEAWTESNEDSPRNQQITIPVVDRAAWIAQGRTLISTLGEHILFHGGPSLVAYWPMNESEGPDCYPAIGGPWTITQTKRVNAVGNPNAEQGSITFGSNGIAPADDVSAVLFEPSTTTTPAPDYVQSLMLTGTRSTTLTYTPGQVLTVACWTRPGELLAGAFSFAVIEVAHGDPVFGPSDTFVNINISDTGLIIATANTDTWTAAVIGPPAPTDVGIPIAFRVGVSPSVCELWVRNEIYTGSISGAPGSWTFDDLNVGDRYPGALHHAQVYLGSASDWTREDFVAQYQMGLTGLERQTTGERIRAILQYAGVDANELGRIDGGASLMQVSRMVGRSPMDLVAEAVETEQGEFYFAGDNRPVFADRIRLLNV